MSTTGWFLKLGEYDNDVMKVIEEGTELVHCSYSLHQGIQNKDQKQTDVHIGGIDIVYDGLPSDFILDWGMSSDVCLKGVLVYVDANSNNNHITKLFFEYGVCVALSINYASDGTSHNILTALSIKPKTLTLGASSRQVIENWSRLVEHSAGPSSNELVRIHHAGNTNLELHFHGVSYAVTRFRMDFTQDTDFKGQTCSDTDGGTISFSINQLPSGDLEDWMVKSEGRNGKFVFVRKDDNNPLTIQFSQAFCVQSNTRTFGGKVQTNFVIVAQQLVLNSNTFNNTKL